MYSYISGILAEEEENYIVIDNHGIGYEIAIPTLMHEYLPGVGQEVKIYTYHYVREDANLLYGFLTKGDVEVFKLLLGVSGIGPKGALAILSVMSVEDLQFAIVSGDSKSIAKAQGVGGKTAQRVIIELKDKFDYMDSFDQKLAKSTGNHPKSATANLRNDAILALTALGYSQSEAAKALHEIEIEENDTVEDILKKSLKKMAFI